MEAAGKLTEITGEHTVTADGGNIRIEYTQLQPGVSLFLLGDGDIATGIGEGETPRLPASGARRAKRAGASLLYAVPGGKGWIDVRGTEVRSVKAR